MGRDSIPEEPGPDFLFFILFNLNQTTVVMKRFLLASVFALVAAGAFVGCSDDKDDAPVPDKYDVISFKDALTDPESTFNTTNWHQVMSVTEGGFDGLYIYYDGEDNIVEGGELDEDGQVVTPADEMKALFNWVKLGSGLDNEKFAEVDPSTVDVRGVAVQSANLTAEQAQVEAEKILATMPY